MRFLLRPWCWIRGHDRYHSIAAYIMGHAPNICLRCGHALESPLEDPPPIDLKQPFKHEVTRHTYEPKEDPK